MVKTGPGHFHGVNISKSFGIGFGGLRLLRGGNSGFGFNVRGRKVSRMGHYDGHVKAYSRWLNQKFSDALDCGRSRSLLGYAGVGLLVSQLYKPSYPKNWVEDLLYFQVRRVVNKISWGVTTVGYRVGKVCDRVMDWGPKIEVGYARWLMETLGPYDPWWRRALRDLGTRMTTHPEEFEEIRGPKN